MSAFVRYFQLFRLPNRELGCVAGRRQPDNDGWERQRFPGIPKASLKNSGKFERCANARDPKEFAGFITRIALGDGPRARRSRGSRGGRP